jgi:hypothetical protein
MLQAPRRRGLTSRCEIGDPGRGIETYAVVGLWPSFRFTVEYSLGNRSSIPDSPEERYSALRRARR